MFLTKPILLCLTLTALVSADFFGGFGPFGSNGAKKQNNGGKSCEKSTPTTVPVGGSTVSGPTSTAGPKCPEAKYCICERKCGGLGSAEKNTTATSAISSTPTTASNSNAPTSPSTVSETSSTVSEASSTVSSTEASSTVSSTGISSTHKNKKSGELGEENHDEEEWHGLPPQVRKRWLALHGRKHLEQQTAAAGEQNCKMECKCISVPKFSAESEEKSAEHIKGSGGKMAGGGNTGCDYKNKGMQRADCKNARVQKQQKGIVSPINNNPHEQERVKMGNNGILPPQKLDNRGCDHLNEGAQRENCKNARVQEQKQMQIWNKFNRPN